MDYLLHHPRLASEKWLEIEGGGGLPFSVDLLYNQLHSVVFGFVLFFCHTIALQTHTK